MRSCIVGSHLVIIMIIFLRSPQPLLVSYVGAGKISNDAQLTAALDFLTNISGGDAVDAKAFETACGVGIVVTAQVISDEVGKVIETHKSGLLEKRFVSLSLSRVLTARDDAAERNLESIQAVVREEI